MAELAPGRIPLADHDEDWVRVAANVRGVSMRVYIGSVVGNAIANEKAQLEELVGYAARRHGLTFDQAFHRLRNKEPLGDEVPEFPVEPAMEEKLNGLAKK